MHYVTHSYIIDALITQYTEAARAILWSGQDVGVTKIKTTPMFVRKWSGHGRTGQTVGTTSGE